METIKVTKNFKKRTFTIRKYYNGILVSKYRTLPMSKEEFEECEYNTENDWLSFLSSDNYYIA